ncbi:hypothetical protein M501DRAFT_985831 [Patellaria atrata CBS 101060]|uniref:Pathway-specific nitrogen regulator n=1 Tax=Patellaria atrata CBS 101060 TaxID=1346257 RepID=A0A9P4SLC7_9PEZI|nr:hypothetical protein M501DRAFT_985831 [Patellaria atrata CBS 101060]
MAPSFSIYEDHDDHAGEDDILPSIEPHPNGGPVFDPIEPSARRVSALTAPSTISSIPSSIPSNIYLHKNSPYTPMKDRPVFRSPASVRALQMSSPPPLALMELESPGARERFGARRSETPRSTRSGRSGSLLTGGSRAMTPKREKDRRDNPLVLLHVTVLPTSYHWSAESMRAVLPEHIIENFKLLEEKLRDTVLQRGILIPHPRDEYELLEERLLESLELKTPRILKCGHFHLEDEEWDVSRSLGRRNSFGSEGTVQASEYEEVFEDDADMRLCVDCHQPMKYPGVGAGSGKKRWDVKFYAANGLMRAGAWAAAWSEMERVDVEIGPWVPEEIRRELDIRREEEIRAIEEAELDRRRIEEEKENEFMRMASEAEEMKKKEIEEAQQKAIEDAQMNSVAIRDPERENTKHTHSRHSSSADGLRTPKARRKEDIPLTTLLANYLYLVAQDRRNIFIVVLGTLVLSLVFGRKPIVHIEMIPSQMGPIQVHEQVSPSIPETISPRVQVSNSPRNLEEEYPSLDEHLSVSVINEIPIPIVEEASSIFEIVPSSVLVEASSTALEVVPQYPPTTIFSFVTSTETLVSTLITTSVSTSIATIISTVSAVLPEISSSVPSSLAENPTPSVDLTTIEELVIPSIETQLLEEPPEPENVVHQAEQANKAPNTEGPAVTDDAEGEEQMCPTLQGHLVENAVTKMVS